MAEYSNFSNIVADTAAITTVTGTTATFTNFVGSATGAATNSTLTTTKAVSEAESGTTFFLSLAGGFAVTLPAPAAGLNYKFIVKTAPTTAYTIAATGAIIHGMSLISADAAANVAAGITTITVAANQAVVGTEVSLTCDGTLWYVKAFATIAAAITFA